MKSIASHDAIGPTHVAHTRRAVNSSGAFVLLISAHLIWPQLTACRMNWAECAAIGCSHSELDSVASQRMT